MTLRCGHSWVPTSNGAVCPHSGVPSGEIGSRSWAASWLRPPVTFSARLRPSRRSARASSGSASPPATPAVPARRRHCHRRRVPLADKPLLPRSPRVGLQQVRPRRFVPLPAAQPRRRPERLLTARSPRAEAASTNRYILSIIVLRSLTARTPGQPRHCTRWGKDFHAFGTYRFSACANHFDAMPPVCYNSHTAVGGADPFGGPGSFGYR